MKWSAATYLFFVGYVIATAVGFALYLVSPLAMWISMFTVMPVAFAYLAYRYHKRHAVTSTPVEIIKLSAYWIVLSFVLDALIYIAVLPIAFGAKPNWTFFMDQSPWIWLAYASLILTVTVGFYLSRMTGRKFTTS